MNEVLLFLITRFIAAVLSLLCVDTLVGTALASEPTSWLAAGGLIIIFELLVVSRMEDQRDE